MTMSIRSVAQIRAIEDAVIAQHQVPGYTLMTRAAQAALQVLQTHAPAARRLQVLCGTGNNAGDGYVLARLAKAAGLTVQVWGVADPKDLQGDAKQAWQDWLAAGGQVQAWSATALVDVGRDDVIVDAVLGTGLSRPLSGDLLASVQAMNAAAVPVLALDVPTGLQADSGEVMGAAVHATWTVTFIGLKQGFYLHHGPDHVGRVFVDSLQVPDAVLAATDRVAQRVDESLIPQTLPRRLRTAHKGTHGHVLLIGGGIGMPGAVRLAGEACLRTGAGVVTVATHPQHVYALVSTRPELMVYGVSSSEELQPLLQYVDVIAIGPGLGQTGWSRDVFNAALASNKPMVVDADALNLLGQQQVRRDNWVLTPHPGEAARLLKVSNQDVQAARWKSAAAIATQYGGVVVLKGAATVIARAQDLPQVCDRGNPGMASPGMGDVLTGVIAGIAAQLHDQPDAAWRAARAGVLVHALAGDLVAKTQGERGMMALDVCAQLPRCVNP